MSGKLEITPAKEEKKKDIYDLTGGGLVIPKQQYRSIQITPTHTEEKNKVIKSPTIEIGSLRCDKETILNINSIVAVTKHESARFFVEYLVDEYLNSLTKEELDEVKMSKLILKKKQDK